MAMFGLGRERSMVLGKIVRAIGFVSSATIFLWLTGLEIFYSAKRPPVPRPEQGWTVPLQWTHTSYGTPRENEQLLRLFDWGWYLGMVGFAGEGIRKLQEKYEPWKRK